MIRTNFLFLKMMMIVCLVTSISCSFLGDDEQELPPIYFVETPVKISAQIPISTPTPIPTPTVIPEPQAITVDDLIYEVRNVMSSVYSYQYNLEADVFMDAGGIIVPISMTGNGITEDKTANNYFSTGLFGIVTTEYYLQDSDYVFKQNQVSGEWEEFAGTPIGILPVDFWNNTGLKLLDFDYDYAEDFDSKYGDIITLVTDDSEASTLLEILGSANTENIVLRNLNLHVDIKKSNLYVDELRAEFVISNGGEFISEVLGVPALSEVGAAEALIEIQFSDIGQARVKDLIQHEK